MPLTLTLFDLESSAAPFFALVDSLASLVYAKIIASAAGVLVSFLQAADITEMP